MPIDDTLNQVQTQTATLLLVSHVGLVKTLEQVGQGDGRNARSGIFHGEVRCVAFRPQLERHTPFRRKLQGVLEQVPQRQLQGVRVASHQNVLRRQLERKPQAFVLDKGPKRLRHFSHNLV